MNSLEDTTKKLWKTKKTGGIGGVGSNRIRDRDWTTPVPVTNPIAFFVGDIIASNVK